MSMSEYSLSDLTAATGGGGWGGENAWVLIILFALIFGNGNWFGNGNNASQAASTADLQRAVDLNSIQTGQANIGAEIQRGIYEINSATKDASYNNLGEIRDLQAAISSGFANQATCCCQTQRAIDGVNYNLATQSAAIQANSTANAQKILDAISQSKIDNLTAQVQALQGQLNMAGVVRYPMASTYSSGTNPFCGCGGSGF